MLQIILIMNFCKVFANIFLRNFFRAGLVFIFCFTSVACSTTAGSIGAVSSNVGGGAENLAEKKLEDSVIENSSEKNSAEEKPKMKVDVKKLAKEGAYIVGWDIILALGCKAGLHFSVGVCLAADILGDTAIILYSSLEPEEANASEGDTVGDKVVNADKDKFLNKKPKKKIVFNPLDFVFSIGLMTAILLVI